MFIAALFIIAQTGGNLDTFQRLNSSINCGVSMLWNTATKKNKTLIHAMSWMHLKGIMLGDISKSQKIAECMVPFI